MKKVILLLTVLFVFAGAPTLFGQLKTEQKTEEKTEPKTEVKTEQKTEEKTEQESNFSNVFFSKVLLHVPNRFLDLMDIFSLELKFGPALGVSANVTQFFGLGWECGCSGILSKDFHRQYGIGVMDGWKIQAGFYRAEDWQRLYTHGSLKPYWRDGSNFPSCTDSFYNVKTGLSDYWVIELSAVAVAGARVAIHPLEIVDLATGLVGYDLLDDDIKFKAY